MAQQSSQSTVDIAGLKEMGNRQAKIEEQLSFLKEQISKSDSPFALTINEDDYQKRMRRLQVELEAMGKKIGERFEVRIAHLEKIQDNRGSGLT